jgi:S-adenosylmethionine synthetase
VDEVKLAEVVNGLMNLSPRGIREHLHLNRAIYVPTSAYGHFGRTPDAELKDLHLGKDRSGGRAEARLQPRSI